MEWFSILFISIVQESPPLYKLFDPSIASMVEKRFDSILALTLQSEIETCIQSRLLQQHHSQQTHFHSQLQFQWIPPKRKVVDSRSNLALFVRSLKGPGYFSYEKQLSRKAFLSLSFYILEGHPIRKHFISISKDGWQLVNERRTRLWLNLQQVQTSLAQTEERFFQALLTQQRKSFESCGGQSRPMVPHLKDERNPSLLHCNARRNPQAPYTRGLGFIVRALRDTQTDRIAGARQEWTAAKALNDKKAGFE